MLKPYVGAILFEGFRVEDGAQFQSVLQQYCPELSSEYRGTSPRRLIPGTEVSASNIYLYICNCDGNCNICARELLYGTRIEQLQHLVMM